ncbi:hypothetical protein J2J97_31855 (plasmid) [Rhizobium bangladeshense]|uniref:DUF7940 domain-containing protein n=1 Tax=Rhizobium bangladeshense TaxID=1138189 RepID=UPI001A98EBEE|nr:hypothetical protein [Rhizobium bangladeshense]QSY98667.1 hypothetical protein J2J97_31855 [Rhizobium bangladeshense]
MTDILRRLLTFRKDAGHVLWHAWSARLAYLLVLINALDAGVYFVIGYAPVPQWAMGLLSAALGAAIPYARVVVQAKIDSQKGDDHANR